VIHDSYRRLATEFSAQLQLLDSGLNDLFREPPDPSSEPSVKP
jgi:hypothetical protein